MAATAGHATTIKATGTSTGMTAEAMSNVSGLIYQITDTAKRIIDPTVAVTVLDDASPVDAADIESIDFLFGKVTFDSGYSVVGSITITGSYLPSHSIALARSFSFNDGVELPDSTVFGNAIRKYTPALQILSGTLEDLDLVGTVYNGGAISFNSRLTAGQTFVLECDIGGSGVLFRAVVKLESTAAGVSVTDVITQSVSFRGLVVNGAFGSEYAYWGYSA